MLHFLSFFYSSELLPLFSAIDITPYRDAILTYFSDALLLWVAITEPLPVTYLVTLNQSIWFHNPDICPLSDEWVLFETRANYVGKYQTCICFGLIDIFHSFFNQSFGCWYTVYHTFRFLLSPGEVRLKFTMGNVCLGEIQKDRLQLVIHVDECK